ncbi:hypothetical protein CRENPOLYSF2_1030015 [Crenothrix polyspora]|uniref:Uncharacterized protein n=2 Tax=Crenothrix polyspora TaxID=360316 RepID=A0A1R4GYR2_9GAMM|nr:hypothetical protein CRENPOLYSF2_1030015 [Crenothrix polyspora]
MNLKNQDNEESEWTWTVAPAIPLADGRIFVKLLAYDGEFPVSYVYEHPSVTKQGKLIYEVDLWLADMWLSNDETLYVSAEEGEIHTYKNGNWAVTQTPEDSILSSIWGVDSEHIFTSGEGIILRKEGNTWVYTTKDQKTYIDCVRGKSLNNIYAVGRGGLILHFDGAFWNRCDSPTNVNLNSVCSNNGNEFYVVGAEGIVLIGNQNQWKVLNFGDIDFVDVVEYRGKIYIAGLEKGLFCLDGENLILVKKEIHAVRLVSQNNYLCVSGDLSFYRFDGSDWESYTYHIG